MMNGTVLRIREEIDRARRKGVGPRRRFSAKLVARVIDYARTRLDAGAKQSDVFRELGIGRLTLNRWLRGSGTPDSHWRQVEVASNLIEAEPSVRNRSALSLRTPRGIRIEGLDAREAATMALWLEQALG